jgi:calcineurin-like phosphoesterase family protein
MNNKLLDRHYETVSSDDTLIHLGDVAMDMQTGQKTIEYFERLDGDLLLQGNHDVGLEPDEAPFPVLNSCVLEHGEYQFYCTHRPENVPTEWDGWVLHGHHHNNNTDKYPFVAYDERRVNVSNELLDYRPVTLDAVTSLLDECVPKTHLRDIDAARDYLSE